MDLSNIGERIKDRRIKLKMTQKDLADNMHISTQLVSKWENGESIPALNYIEELCLVLKISLNKLVGNKPKIPIEKIDKTTIKGLIISGIVFISIAFIVCFTLLTYYVFVPYGCKDKYIRNIDSLITSYVSNNEYYNVEFIGTLDGEEITNIKLQGYFDENGNVCYYNSETNDIVKDNIKTNSNRYYYKKPENIKNIEDLFLSQLKTIGEDDNVTEDLKEITYIRKVKNGYYLEISDEVFTKDLTNNQKKNYKLTDKILGEVIKEGDMIKSLKITIKYFDEPKNEHFTITSSANFKFEKPVIEHKLTTGEMLAEAPKQEKDSQGFFTPLNATNISRIDDIESDIGVSLNSNNIYINSNNICIKGNNEFIYLDETGSRVIKNDKIKVNKYIENGFTYENGYIYTYDGDNITIFNEDYTIKDIVNFSNDISNIYLYSGNIYYTLRANSSYYSFRVINISNKEDSFIGSIDDSSSVYYNGDYAYTRTSSIYDTYVFKLSTKEKIKTNTDNSIYFVDSSGITYLTAGNYYETEEFVYCVGFYYSNNNNNNIIKFKIGGPIIETLYYYYNIPSSLSNTYNINNYTFKIGENRYYDNTKKVYEKFKPTKIDTNFYNYKSEFCIRIIGIINDKILVGFCNDSNFNSIRYLAYYSVTDLINPIECINVRDVKLIWDSNTNKLNRICFKDYYNNKYNATYLVCF